MRHPKLVAWEKKLKQILDKIDIYLEDTYGRKYILHPSRSKRGTTSNKSHDGLFSIGASFTAGYGSEYGRGYVVDVDMVTLENVPESVRKRIDEDVIKMLKRELPTAFPGKNLKIHKDGNVIKIHGDLSLGTL